MRLLLDTHIFIWWADHPEKLNDLPNGARLNRGGKKLRSQVRAVRIVVAAMLLLVLLSSNVPFASLASAPTCTLSCCAGLLPHAAGSCMGGSCHTGILNGAERIHSAPHQSTTEPEVLCGLPRHLSASGPASRSLGLTIYADTPAESSSNVGVDSATQSNPRQARVAALVKPCEPDCGGCGSGSINSNVQRNPGTVAHAEHPRPSSDLRLAVGAHHKARNLDALARRGTTRGPPNSFA